MKQLHGRQTDTAPAMIINCSCDGKDDFNYTFRFPGKNSQFIKRMGFLLTAILFVPEMAVSNLDLFRIIIQRWSDFLSYSPSLTHLLLAHKSDTSKMIHLLYDE